MKRILILFIYSIFTFILFSCAKDRSIIRSDQTLVGDETNIETVNEENEMRETELYTTSIEETRDEVSQVEEMTPSPKPLPSPKITDSEAVEVYSMAINLIYEGLYEQALKKLRYLLSVNVIDEIIYEELLSIYIDMIQQRQIVGNNRDISSIIKDAKKYAVKALTYFPQNMPILYSYAEISGLDGDSQAYYKTLERILTIDKNEALANFLMGAYYYKNQDNENAIPYFYNVIGQTSSLTKRDLSASEMDLLVLYQSYYQLGMISVQSMNYEDAVYYFEEAKFIYSSDLDLIKYLGFIYSQLLNFNETAENLSMIPIEFMDVSVAELLSGAMFIAGLDGLNEILDEFIYESPFIRAIKYYSQKKYQESIDELDIHMDSQGVGDFYAHYLYYMDYTQMKEYSEAKKHAYYLGVLAKEAGKYTIAIKYFKLMESDTNSIPEIYWLIGSLYDDSGDTTNAIAYYNMYLSYPEKLPNKVFALVRLSFMYYEQDEIANSMESIELAKQSANTDAERSMVYLYSGLVNLEFDRLDEAIDDIDTAFLYDSDNIQLYYFISTAYFRKKEFSLAIKYLKKGREFYPNSPEVNNLLAYTYAIENINLDEAVDLVNLALSNDPNNTAYNDTLGWIYFQRGEYQKAREIFNKIEVNLMSLEDLTGMDEIYYHIGMIYEKLDNTNEAVKFYLEGKEINPDSEEINRRLEALQQ